MGTYQKELLEYLIAKEEASSGKTNLKDRVLNKRIVDTLKDGLSIFYFFKKQLTRS